MSSVDGRLLNERWTQPATALRRAAGTRRHVAAVQIS